MSAVPRPCLSCGGDGFRRLLTDCRDVFLGHAPPVNYDECSQCGLIQQRPPVDNAPVLYSDYPMHRPASPAYAAMRRVLTGSAYQPPRRVIPYIGPLLDFGCGSGHYLAWCKEQSVEAVGYEPNPGVAKAVATWSGCPVLSSLEDLHDNFEGRFAAITAHFVLEHVPDPFTAIADLYGLLGPGGILSFTLPDPSSWEFRAFGKHWHGLDPPRHICFPQPQHVRSAADASGYEYLRDQPFGFVNSLAGSLAGFPNGRFSWARFYLALPVALPISMALKSGSRRFLLRRPE